MLPKNQRVYIVCISVCGLRWVAIIVVSAVVPDEEVRMATVTDIAMDMVAAIRLHPTGQKEILGLPAMAFLHRHLVQAMDFLTIVHHLLVVAWAGGMVILLHRQGLTIRHQLTAVLADMAITGAYVHLNAAIHLRVALHLKVEHLRMNPLRETRNLDHLAA